MRLSNVYPVVLLAFSSILVTGCFGSDTAEVTPESSQDTSQQKAAESEKSTTGEYVSPLGADAPVYKIATESSYEPFVSQDPLGKIEGLDVDLIRAIGEKQGFKVEFYTMPWKEVYPSLLANKYDIAMSGIHITEDRKERFGVSSPYLIDTVQIVSQESAGIASASDLSGKKVGAQTATAFVDVANNMSNVTVISQPTTFALLKDLAQNKSVAFLTDRALAVHIAKEFPEVKLKYSNAVEESHGIAFYTNKDNTELLAKINTGLSEIKQNGRYNQINKKWFGDSADKLMVK